MLIISPFNPVWFGCLIGGFAALGIATRLVRSTSARFRENLIAGAMIFTFICFWIYKYSVSIDMEYLQLRQEAGLADEQFSWWLELCLHLCNINMILIPFAVKLKKRGLLFITSVIGPLGALAALLMPGIGFAGYSLLTGRVLGFYFTHLMVLFGGLSVIAFDLYTPSLCDVPKGLASLFLLNFVIFLFNITVRSTGIETHANYFYNMEPEGNPILELFYSWLPVPFLYTVFLLPIAAAWSYLFIWMVNRHPIPEATRLPAKP
ncbi:MAG: YwaF family protein [Firmicutes bacterium]|nr:YwaF family protein [Bacillota bacterium]